MAEFQIIISIVVVGLVISQLFMLLDVFNLKAYIKDHDNKLVEINRKIDDNSDELRYTVNNSIETNSVIKDLEYKVNVINERMKEKPVEFCSYDAYRAEYERTKKEV